MIIQEKQNKKLIKEGKKVSVLVAYTQPETWEAIQKTGITVQKAHAPEAEYIAFIFTGFKQNGKRLNSWIECYVKVKKTEIAPFKKYFDQAPPSFKSFAKKKGWPLTEDDKFYYLEKIKKLPNIIEHKRGNPSRGQVYFLTKFNELFNSKYIQDIKISRY